MLKLENKYDVIVCGGGPAGMGAAITAAWMGLKTLLVEQQFFLGGMGTAAGVHTFSDTPYGPVFKELAKQILDYGAGKVNYNPELHYKTGRLNYHIETLKAISMKMVHDAGCDIMLGTVVVGTLVEEDILKGVYLGNKHGSTLVKTKVVIDTTGDGDVAALAGAEFMKGDPEDGRIMHVNFKFQTDGIDWDLFRSKDLSDDYLAKLFKGAVDDGIITPPSGAFAPAAECFPFNKRNSTFGLGKWEIENVDPSDPVQVSNTVEECQVAAFEVIEFCRKNLPGFENARISGFPASLGTRESRRIKGKYTLTKDDVVGSKKFDDGIAKAAFFIDFHDSPPGKTIPYSIEYKKENSPAKGDYYEIPYGCLVPEKIKGLLVAGRCISATREGLASMRVRPTCMYTGTAAGIAAALSINKNILPDEISGQEVKREIAVLESSHT